jgi:hypothetical protein
VVVSSSWAEEDGGPRERSLGVVIAVASAISFATAECSTVLPLGVGSVCRRLLLDETHIVMSRAAFGADEPIPEASGLEVRPEPNRQGRHVHIGDVLTPPAGHPHRHAGSDHVPEAVEVFPPHDAG